MWWLLLSLLWTTQTTQIQLPNAWKCPKLSLQPVVECGCDMPHTLRCTGDASAITLITQMLRTLAPAYVSLLDCTVQNVTKLIKPLLEGIALHGLVISSGEISEIGEMAFCGLASPIQALGLPNNKLKRVPNAALKRLPELDRLDLSGNQLKKLENSAFKGLKNLSFIDLNNNVLTKIDSNVFDNLTELRMLRLRGNRLTISSISSLSPIPTLEELDLTDNDLIGPLDPKTFPKLMSLRTLQLSHNSLSSIKMSALSGLPNLVSLSINYNQIDVLEDHAFNQLKKLHILELSHNRIVAVSGQSLTHLINLKELDLRHNFLRALTADLVHPLKALRNLKLDDNDISIIASDAFWSNTTLKHLTLFDNPLNCDCSLTEFGVWLQNSSLPQTDLESIICTTPPSLENGLLVEINLDKLICSDTDDQEIVMTPLSTSEQYKSKKITLFSFNYNNDEIRLIWSVKSSLPYKCDAIFVYEEEGPNEVLVESNSLKCNSSEIKNSELLKITVPDTIRLELGHRYRYCIVLFEVNNENSDVSLMLGCSEIILLIPSSVKHPKILSIYANLSTLGSLSINVKLYPNDSKCQLNLALLKQNNLISQRKINCSDKNYIFIGLQEGPYRVCGSIISENLEVSKASCILVLRDETNGLVTFYSVIVPGIFIVMCLVLFGLIWTVKKILSKLKNVQNQQCFVHDLENKQHCQHSRYVKLEATTIL